MKLTNHHLQSLLEVRPLGRVYAGCRVGPKRKAVLVRQLLPGLPPDECEETARVFRIHMERLATLEDPSTLPVREFVADESGIFFYVTEVPQGITLAEFLAGTGSVPVATAAAIGVRIAECLAHAHVRGICHLALSPNQILLGSNHELTLLDLGLVPLLLDRVRERLRYVNSAWNQLFPYPGAVAPELIAGEETGVHTDVYGVGTLLYLMSTGVLPYIGTAVVAYNSIVSGTRDADPRRETPDIEPAFADLVRRCLSRRPGDRPQSIDIVLRELRHLAVPLETALAPYKTVAKERDFIDRFDPLLRVVDGGGEEKSEPSPPPSPAVVPLFSDAEMSTNAKILAQMTPAQHAIYLRQPLDRNRSTAANQLLVVILLAVGFALIAFFPDLLTFPGESSQSSTIVSSEEAAPLQRRQAELEEEPHKRHSIILYLKDRGVR